MNLINEENIEQWMFDYHEGMLTKPQEESVLRYLEKHPELHTDFLCWEEAKVKESFPDRIPFEQDLFRPAPRFSAFIKLALAVLAVIIIFVILYKRSWLTSASIPIDSQTTQIKNSNQVKGSIKGNNKTTDKIAPPDLQKNKHTKADNRKSDLITARSHVVSKDTITDSPEFKDIEAVTILPAPKLSVLKTGEPLPVQKDSIMQQQDIQKKNKRINIQWNNIPIEH